MSAIARRLAAAAAALALGVGLVSVSAPAHAASDTSWGQSVAPAAPR